MGPIQQRNVHRLVATGLSTPGYVTVALIMGLDNILDQLEGWSVDFGRERGRDPLLYYVTIFGEPGGDAPWGWRFGGHHVSLHYTIIGGEVVASTPNFLGADPADSPLLGPHLHRPLAAAEDLGRELFRVARRAQARAGAGLAGGAHGSGRLQPPEPRARRPAAADRRHLPPAVRRPARRARGRHAVADGGDARRAGKLTSMP